MMNQVKKLALAPWKKPSNWLHSFKPSKIENIEDIQKKHFARIARVNKFKSDIDMTSNNHEHRPSFSTSTKEAFVPKHKFSDFKR